MSRTRDVMMMAASSYSGLFFGLIGNIVIARRLGPEVLGDYALATVYVELIYMLGGVSFATAQIRSSRDSRALLSNALLLSGALTSCLFILSLVVSYLLFLHGAPSQVSAGIPILAGCRSCLAISDCYSKITERDLRFGPSAASGAVASLSSYLIAAVLAFYFHSIIPLLVRDVISTSVIAGVVCSRCQYGFEFRPDPHIARELIRVGLELFRLRVVEVASDQSDKIIVARWWDAASLGLYSQATRLAALGYQLTQGSFLNVTFSHYSRATQQTPEQISELHRAMQGWLLRLCAVPSLGCLLAAEPAIRFFYGESWNTTGSLLREYWIVILLFPMAENTKLLLLALGEKRLPLARLFSLCVYVSGTLLASKFHSLEMMPRAATAASFSYLLALDFLTRRHFRQNLALRHIILFSICLLLFYASGC